MLNREMCEARHSPRVFRPAKRRALMAHLMAAYQVSVRKACRALRDPRSSHDHKFCRPSQAVLSKRIREIAETPIRYGYRRIHVMLRREGWEVNDKRAYRLYAEEGLQIRNKRPKRKVAAKLRDGCAHEA